MHCSHLGLTGLLAKPLVFVSSQANDLPVSRPSSSAKETWYLLRVIDAPAMVDSKVSGPK